MRSGLNSLLAVTCEVRNEMLAQDEPVRDLRILRLMASPKYWEYAHKQVQSCLPT